MDSPGDRFGNQDCSLHCSPSEGFRYVVVVCGVVVVGLVFYWVGFCGFGGFFGSGFWFCLVWGLVFFCCCFVVGGGGFFLIFSLFLVFQSLFIETG